MKQFCCKCYEDVDVIYKEGERTEKIDDATITYLEKYYVCKKCGNEFYGDLLAWFNTNGSRVPGLTKSGNTITISKNGVKVTFSTVADILAMDIYDFEKTISNIKEVKARGAKVLMLTNQKNLPTQDTSRGERTE